MHKRQRSGSGHADGSSGRDRAAPRPRTTARSPSGNTGGGSQQANHGTSSDAESAADAVAVADADAGAEETDGSASGRVENAPSLPLLPACSSLLIVASAFDGPRAPSSSRVGDGDGDGDASVPVAVDIHVHRVGHSAVGLRVSSAHSFKALLRDACARLKLPFEQLRAVRDAHRPGVEYARSPTAWKAAWGDACRRARAMAMATRTQPQLQAHGSPADSVGSHAAGPSSGGGPSAMPDCATGSVLTLQLFASLDDETKFHLPYRCRGLLEWAPDPDANGAEADSEGDGTGAQPSSAFMTLERTFRFDQRAFVETTNGITALPTQQIDVALHYPNLRICTAAAYGKPAHLTVPTPAMGVTLSGHLEIGDGQQSAECSGAVSDPQLLRLEETPLNEPVARQVRACLRQPIGKLTVHRTTPALTVPEDPAAVKQVPINSDRPFIFDTCMLMSKQMLVCLNFVRSEGERGESYHLLLDPRPYHYADVYLVSQSQLNHWQNSQYNAWLSMILRSCLRPASAAGGVEPRRLTPSISVLPGSVSKVSFPLFLVLDLDKTLLLNEDNYRESQEKEKQRRQQDVRAQLLPAAEAAKQVDKQFEPHLVAAKTPITLRPNTDKFLQAVSTLFQVSVLTAGSTEYAQEIIKRGNALGWRPPPPQAHAAAARAPAVPASGAQQSPSCSNGHSHLDGAAADVGDPWQKRLDLVFPAAGPVVCATVIVDDDAQVWRNHRRLTLFRIREATPASCKKHEDNPAAVTALLDCSNRLRDFHARWMSRFRAELMLGLYEPVARRVWAHLLFMRSCGRLTSHGSGTDVRDCVDNLAHQLRSNLNAAGCHMSSAMDTRVGLLFAHIRHSLDIQTPEPPAAAAAAAAGAPTRPSARLTELLPPAPSAQELATESAQPLDLYADLWTIACAQAYEGLGERDLHGMVQRCGKQALQLLQPER